jgi:hypothetical protein
VAATPLPDLLLVVFMIVALEDLEFEDYEGDSENRRRREDSKVGSSIYE